MTRLIKVDVPCKNCVDCPQLELVTLEAWTLGNQSDVMLRTCAHAEQCKNAIDIFKSGLIEDVKIIASSWVRGFDESDRVTAESADKFVRDILELVDDNVD